MSSAQNPLGLAPFDPGEYLTDELVIAEFLNESLRMNDPAVMLNAINTVARARGMSQLALQAGLGRENLYNALKPGAKPRFETVVKLLDALGLALVATPKQEGVPRAAEPEPAYASTTARGHKTSGRREK